MPSLTLLVKKTDSPALAAAVTAAAWIVFVACLLAARGGDISRFVIAGGPGVEASRVPPGLTVLPGGGYDGAVFYRLALDPFTTEQTAYGITLDNPSYRQQRIGYPLAVWALSLGGRPRFVPWMLVLVNLIAVTILAALGGALCRHYGQHALGGVVFAFFPGFLWTMSRDLSEITACCLVLAAVLALTVRRFTAAGVLLALAVITRETTLVYAIAIAGIHVLDRLRRRTPAVPAVAFLTPIGAYAGVQLVLASVWDALPATSGRPPLTIPFAEFARTLAWAWSRRIQLQRLYFEECVFLAIVVLVTLYVVVRARPRAEWVLAWCGYMIIAFMLVPAPWTDDIVFLRIMSDLFVTSAVIAVSGGLRLPRVVLTLAALALWLRLAPLVIALG